MRPPALLLPLLLAAAAAAESPAAPFPLPPPPPPPLPPLEGLPPPPLAGVFRPDASGGGRTASGEEVLRLALPDGPLSLGASVELSGEFEAVAEGDNPLAVYRPFALPRSARGTAAGGVEAAEADDAVTFYVYTADRALDARVALTRPSVSSLAGDALRADLAGFEEGAAHPLPHVDVGGGHGVRAVMGVPLTVNLACLKPGRHRFLVHLNVVATPDRAAPAPPPRVTPIPPPEGGRGAPELTRRRLLAVPPAPRARYHASMAFGFTKVCGDTEAGGGGGPAGAPQVRIPGLVIGTRDVARPPAALSARSEWPLRSRDVAEDGVVGDDFREAGSLHVVGAREQRTTFFVRRLAPVTEAGDAADPGGLLDEARDELDRSEREEQRAAGEAEAGGGDARFGGGVLSRVTDWLGTVAKSVHGLTALTFKRATVTADDPTVVTVRAAGTLGTAASTVLGGSWRAPSMADLAVTYSCLRDGDTVVTVQLPTSQGPVSWSVLKQCTGHDDAPVEGVPTPGLCVGTTPRQADVVLGGLTAPAFRTGASEEAEDIMLVAQGFVVGSGGDEDETTFYMWLDTLADTGQGGARHRPVVYRRPLVVAEPPLAGGVGGPPVAFPLLRGSATQTDFLERGRAPVELVVRYRCVRDGLTPVTVKVPLSPIGAGELTFTFAKVCAAPEDKEEADKARADAAPQPVPGLSVGTPGATRRGGGVTGDGARGDFRFNVVRDGVPADEWSWRSSVDRLHTFGPERPYALFTVSFDGGAAAAAGAGAAAGEMSVQVDPPTLFSHYRVLEAELGGGAKNGFDMAHEARRSLTVNFNCLESPPGTPEEERTTMVTLVLPVTVRQRPPPPADGRMVKRRAAWNVVLNELVVVTFAKVCPPYGADGKPALVRPGAAGHADGGSELVPAGGVAVPGLCVGLRPAGSEVVLDGFPRVEYFGHALSSAPGWDTALLPRGKNAIELFVHFSSDVEGDEAVVFQAPTLVTHGGGTLRAVAAGSAAGGGTLSRNGNSLELSLSFECRYSGTGAVTVNLPVRDHGVVSFTVPKACGGAERPAGLLMPGVRVGTVAGGQDVVNNGSVSRFFTPDRGLRHMHVPLGQGQSHFFVAYDGDGGSDGPLQVLEPIVYAHRPLVNVRVRHSLAHALVRVAAADGAGDDGDGATRLEDSDTYAIAGRDERLEVEYSCLYEGRSLVTLLIPVLPRGQISFSWLKQCVDTKAPRVEGPLEGAGAGAGAAAPPPAARGPAAGPAADEDAGDAADGGDADDADVFGSADGAAEDESDFDPDAAWFAAQERMGGGAGGGAADDNAGAHADRDGAWNRDEWAADVGYIDVGSGPGEARRSDVVRDGMTRPAYVMPQHGGSTAASLAGRLAAKIVPATVSSSEFYLSVPAEASGKRQRFGLPAVVVGDPSVAQVSVTGDAAGGATLEKGSAPQLLRLTYACRAPGVTPVIVMVPLVPRVRGTVSFRVAKVCGGFVERSEGTYMTAGRLLTTGVMTFSFLAGLAAYTRFRGVPGGAPGLATVAPGGRKR